MNEIARFVHYAFAEKGVKRKFFISQLFLVGVVIFDLLIPLLIKTIVDEGIALQDMEVVVRNSLWMVLFAFLSTLLAIINIGYAVGFASDTAHGLRVSAYRKIQTLSFGNLDRFQTSDLLVRLTSDVNIFKMMVLLMSAVFFKAPIMLVGAVFFAYVTGPSLVWILLVIMLVVLVMLVAFFWLVSPMFKAVQTRLDRLNLVLQENLSGVRVVKAFVRSDYETNRFDQRNDGLRGQALKPMRVTAFLSPALMLVFNVGTAAVLWFGGRESILEGTLTVGELMAFSNYLLTATIPLVLVAVLLPQVTAANASMGRIFEIFDAEPDIQEKPDARALSNVKGRVDFDNVTFSYLNDDGTPNETPVLKNLNLTAEPGQMVAILGATGAGKSSLINLIPRFYDVTEGRVTIDGVDVRDLRLDDLRQHVGICLQQAILFSGTVADNVRYGRPAETTEEEIITYAETADAHGFISAQVDGYDSRVAREGANFSGGQRQRIAIARALSMKPNILILDDSTSAVDVATETRIQTAMAELTQGVTTFVVAQRLSTVLIADKIIVLDSGEIVAEGTHRELLASSPIYQEINESQLGGVEEFNG
jgi:ATP-binding cassette subfamily B protein